MTKFTLPFYLSQGSHDSPADGLSAMEAVAWLEGLEHTYRPSCTCPVVAAYVCALNEELADADRQRLVPFLPELVGTVSATREQERSDYLVWQTLTVCVPAALDAGSEAEVDRAQGVSGYARQLRTLPDGDWTQALDILNRITGDEEEDGPDFWLGYQLSGVVQCARWATGIVSGAGDIPPWTVTADKRAVEAARLAGSAVTACSEVTGPTWQDAAFEMLDGVLAIGPAGTFSTPDKIVSERVSDYMALLVP